MNVAVILGGEKETVFWAALQEYFDWLEKKAALAPIFGMYGLVMTSVASRLGNRGQYEASSAINEKIVKEALRLRTFGYVRRNLHGLLNCLMVDIYCKDDWMAAKMRKRLE